MRLVLRPLGLPPFRVAAVGLFLGACAVGPRGYRATLRQEARLLAPLIRTRWVRDFLSEVERLPPAPVRRILCSRKPRRCYRARQAQRLPAVLRGHLRVRRIDARSYYARYGSPLAYARALDLAARAGLRRPVGRRILDFGYGSIGQLRLLAQLGAHVTGVDPDQRLDAWYGGATDQGTIAGAGSIRLVTGRFPADAAVRKAVGSGYDLILAKNVLKEGYLRPRRPAPSSQLIRLGVDADTFLRVLAHTVRPGGLVVVYNLYPRQNPPSGRYIPWADGKTAFGVPGWRRAGLEVLAFDVDDTAFARRMGRLLGWHRGPDAMRLDDLFAVYSIFRRPTSRRGP